MRTILASVMLALLAACASTSQVMVGQARAPITPDQVRIYNQPPPHYQEVALLETQSGGFTYGEQNKMDEILANLRKSAAALGANGVLLAGHGNAYSGGNVGVGVGRSSYGSHSRTGVGVGVNISPSPKHARAMAIWVDPNAPVDAVPSKPLDSKPLD